MRIGIVGLLHESNTFISTPTTVAHFEQDTLLEGEPIRVKFSGTHHEIGGFFEGLAEADVEAVPIFVARAVPYGTIAAEAYTELSGRLLAAVEKALAGPGTLDGLLVAPHGATVAENARDADGDWLGRVRQLVGGELPVIGTLDPHANLSARMVAATDALIAYRTNPHLDQRARGRQAARLIARAVRGEVRPVQAASFPPLAINIEKQATAVAPCLPLYELADRQLDRPGVLSNSVLLGFPYADVEELGSAALAVTDGDSSLAAALADELGDYLWQHRAEFVGTLRSVEEVLEELAGCEGPICLLDMGDNVGGGSPADGTILAHALLRHGELSPAVVCLYDPAAAAAAFQAGVGAELELAVGGHTDDLHGPPLRAAFHVQGLYSGQFHEPEPRHGGFTHCDQGPSAVLTTGPLTVLVTSKRMPPFSLHQLTSCGLRPETFRVLVAKGVNAPLAAYRPICSHLIRVNTPGVTTADMTRMPYAYRRRPLFPFEST